MVALALAVGAAACGGGETTAATTPSAASGEPPARPVGTLRVAVPGQPEVLDPSRTVSNFDLPITTALYDGLVTRKPHSYDELSPALAESWSSNDDASVWTFKLRRGVTFSDGAAFDSAAAKKSLEFYQRRNSIWGFALGQIDKLETPDRDTLVVSYKNPFPDFPRYMALVKMLSPKSLTGPADVVEKRVAKGAAGTGPYILDSFSSSRGVFAHANPSYWGDGPYIEQLEFRPIVEESAQNAALQAGDIDLVAGVAPRAAQSLASDPRLQVTTVPSWTSAVLSLPTQQKPLDDVRVRQALAYAIDPQSIAKNVLLGYANVIGTPIPPGAYGQREPATKYSYDPAKARALLEEAGVSQPVKLKMVTYSNMPSGTAIGEALVQQAKAGGFDIEFAQVPSAVGNADLNAAQRRWQIHLVGTGYLSGSLLHLAGGFITQRSNYTGEKLLNLVRQINGTPDGPKRKEIVGQAIDEMATQLPEIPLFTMKVSDASVKTLKNHLPNADGIFLPNWSEQYLEQ